VCDPAGEDKKYRRRSEKVVSGIELELSETAADQLSTMTPGPTRRFIPARPFVRAATTLMPSCRPFDASLWRSADQLVG